MLYVVGNRLAIFSAVDATVYQTDNNYSLQTESSARSTPRKKQSNLPLEGVVSPRGHTSLPSYVLDASRDDGASEGEVTNSVTVQDILVKLDSVKVHVGDVCTRSQESCRVFD